MEQAPPAGESPKPLDLELTLSDTLYRKGDEMKIGEISRRYEISADTLRFYERVGLIGRVKRDKNGIRDYEETDTRRIEFIKCMRNAGLPIEVLIEYVGLVQQGDETAEARKEILKEQRKLLAERLKEMQETLELLDYKIAAYEKALLKAEQAIAQPQEAEVS